VKASREPHPGGRDRRVGNPLSPPAPPPLPAPLDEWAYFFDIDGTLVDLAPTPSEILLERSLHALLLRLHERTGGALALISGRAIHDVDSIFSGSLLSVAGQPGIERRDARGKISRHDSMAQHLETARDALTGAVAKHPGLILEDKELSLALHYRQVPSLASFAHRLMRRLAASMGGEYTILKGKRVVELRPSGKDKGEAIREFMQEKPFRGRIPAFLGDDVTDEHGFKVVNTLGGCSIKVGPGATAARWRLPDVRSVQSWLEEHELERRRDRRRDRRRTLARR